jgi:propanol-preferring alcohol dehydrogenase
MKAAQVISPREPLELRELPNPEPAGKQVVVQVHSSGVCHSDIHIGKEVMKVPRDSS